MSIVTDRKEIERLVREEVSRLTEKDGEAVDANADLQEALGMDSLYMLEMYAMIEGTFGVMIPTESLQDMNTFNKIADTIEEFQRQLL